MEMIDPNIGFVQQQQAIAEQQRLAQLLRKRAESDPAQGRMVGNQYIAPSVFQQLAPLLANYKAGEAERGVANAQQQYTRSVNEAANQWRSALPRAVAAQPELQGPRDISGSPELDAKEAQPVTSEQVLKHSLAGMNIPGMQDQAKAYATVAQGEITREDTQRARREDLKTTAAARIEAKQIEAETRLRELEAKMADRAASREQLAAYQAESLQVRREQIANTRALAELTAGKKSQPKPMPATMGAAYRENNLALNKLEDALEGVEANPKSFGLKNYLPDAYTQRRDPKGVNARARVADIGSLKLHQRSGATVTISEQPRLLPFIPSVQDNAEAIKEKLANLKKEYEYMLEEIEAAAAMDNYTVPPRAARKTGGGATPPTTPDASPKADSSLKGGAPVKVSTPAEASKLPKGTQFVTPDGQVRVRQ
jgi:hypothetical protein